MQCILANIWYKWVSKETLVNAARKVDVAGTLLSVDLIQQNQFGRAAECMVMNEDKPSSSASLPSTPSELIVSPNKRHRSVRYWKKIFKQAMNIIDELHEKRIQLNEIPGFMTVQKVKSKLSKKNTRILQSIAP